MANRYKPETVYERDGWHVYINRGYGLDRIAVYVSKSLGQGIRLLTEYGEWITVQEGEAFPRPSFVLPAKAMLVLKYALDEAEPLEDSVASLFANALKLEQGRVDRLLEHVLKGNHDS